MRESIVAGLIVFVLLGLAHAQGPPGPPDPVSVDRWTIEFPGHLQQILKTADIPCEGKAADANAKYRLDVYKTSNPDILVSGANGKSDANKEWALTLEAPEGGWPSEQLVIKLVVDGIVESEAYVNVVDP